MLASGVGKVSGGCLSIVGHASTRGLPITLRGQEAHFWARRIFRIQFCGVTMLDWKVRPPVKMKWFARALPGPPPYTLLAQGDYVASVGWAGKPNIHTHLRLPVLLRTSQVGLCGPTYFLLNSMRSECGDMIHLRHHPAKMRAPNASNRLLRITRREGRASSYATT